MRDSFTLRFLYRTVPGRMILKLLVQPKVSEAAGRFLSSRASGWLVLRYIRKYKIDMSNIEVPAGGFKSFNAFFTRKRRIVSYDLTGGHLISPCDGFLTFAEIRGNMIFDIKHTKFSLEDLLGDDRLAAKFRDGAAFIFRLTPADYHRYCYAAGGRIIRDKKIRGKLHCVRPVALRELPVFVQNSREYQVIRTRDFGTIVQMEVGALLVGKINNHSRESAFAGVQAGQEKGYFEFGGSTIIVLLRKDAVCFCGKLYERKNSGGEIPVHMGECVAVSLLGNADGGASFV